MMKAGRGRGGTPPPAGARRGSTSWPLSRYAACAGCKAASQPPRFATTLNATTVMLRSSGMARFKAYARPITMQPNRQKSIAASRRQQAQMAGPSTPATRRTGGRGRVKSSIPLPPRTGVSHFCVARGNWREKATALKCCLPSF